jgi:hypothetical protein
VLGVRFPFRSENRQRPMSDHPLFMVERRRPMVVLSEVKTGQCGLNGPWTDPERQNMQKVLCAGGFRPTDQVEEIARALYGHGVWQDENLVIHIVCFGNRHNSGLARSHPSVPQLISIKKFCLSSTTASTNTSWRSKCTINGTRTLASCLQQLGRWPTPMSLSLQLKWSTSSEGDGSVQNQPADALGDEAQEGHVFIIERGTVEKLPDGEGRAH